MVEEERETIEVTKGDRVVARLVPTSEPKQTIEERDTAAWNELKRIASELAPYWPKDVDAVEIVHDVRRDL